MGSITINGKKVKSITIGGKKVKSITIGGKVLTLVQQVVDPNANSFTGTWNTTQIENDFMNIGEIMPTTQEFLEHSGITGISLPITTTIPAAAFAGLHLTSLNIPKAITIGQLAFASIVNAATTNVTMNKRLDAERDRIFGVGNWSNITFHWLNDDGSAYDPNANSFTGIFSSQAKEDEFMAVTTTVSGYSQQSQYNLTGITLPQVTNIGEMAFRDSPLTNINIPKATTIGASAFYKVVNSASTEVWMNKKFDNNSSKDSIFGYNKWNNITFHWTNDDGTPA